MQHIPVLLDAVAEALSPPNDAVVVDATVGCGGHARRLLEAIGRDGRLIGLDVDAANLAAAASALAAFGDRVQLVRRNFGELPDVMRELGVPYADAILADLGVSSTQLDDPGRGLTFSQDGPLDMRLDDRLERTAADLVNALPERELADLIYHNSQERFSRRIAKRICEARRNARIRRTAELARIVASAVGVDPASRKSKIHPATRTFQALRMAVNDEVGHLERFLEHAPSLLRPQRPDREGGRIAVISFHSVEDGRVKRRFRQAAAAGELRVLTKKPVTPEPAELERNPRARSAKLRVAQRVESSVTASDGLPD